MSEYKYPSLKGFKLEVPEPSPEYKALQERRSKYDIEGDLIDDEKYDYETLTSDPVQYKKIGKESKFRNVYKESPIMKRFYKDLEERQKNNPFKRKTGGKAFGPPPEKGPQPQGMKDGRLIEPKLNKRKRYDINPFLKIKRSEYSKTIKTDKGYTNVPSMYGGQEYGEDFLTELYKDNKTDPETGRRVKTYRTPEEATVAAKRRSSRLKEGGMTGCPHRENGVKSDIKGISDIQVKGKKFIGVK